MIHRIFYALLLTLIFAFPVASVMPVYADSKISANDIRLCLPGKDNQERWKWLSRHLKDLASSDRDNAMKLLGLPKDSHAHDERLLFAIDKNVDAKSGIKYGTLLIVTFRQGRVGSLTIHSYEYTVQEMKDVGPS
ncbi:MAG: hypothetical protein LCH63_20995 [Candidatus Melainabacteria bacterium]|nr:hypothetical protein [Candidatus Melainabacteria bacterium]